MLGAEERWKLISLLAISIGVVVSLKTKPMKVKYYLLWIVNLLVVFWIKQRSRTGSSTRQHFSLGPSIWCGKCSISILFCLQYVFVLTNRSRVLRILTNTSQTSPFPGVQDAAQAVSVGCEVSRSPEHSTHWPLAVPARPADLLAESLHVTRRPPVDHVPHVGIVDGEKKD